MEHSWHPIMHTAISFAQILKNCVTWARTLVEHQSTMQFQQNRWPHGVTVVCLLVSRHSEHLRLTSSARSARSVPTSLHHLLQANKTRCNLILSVVIIKIIIYHLLLVTAESLTNYILSKQLCFTVWTKYCRFLVFMLDIRFLNMCLLPHYNKQTLWTSTEPAWRRHGHQLRHHGNTRLKDSIGWFWKTVKMMTESESKLQERQPS